MNRRHLLTSLTTTAALALTSCGGGGTPAAKPDRTVRVEMVDLAFQPDRLEARAGETVRFVFHNSGQADHDAFIGERAAQAEHEKEMGGMNGHGRSDEAVTVKPGKTDEIIYTFGKAGRIEVGCHQPGHWRAGMRLSITVR